MNEANLGILLTVRDNASPGLKGLENSLVQNKAAFRELGMGVAFLGASFIGMGLALENSTNLTAKSIGHNLLLAGSFMTAIGSAVQFISAISKVISALRTLITTEILLKAFQGPASWAMLAAGGAIAAGTVAGVSAMEKSQKNITINNHIAGSVRSDKELADVIRREIVITQQQNNTSGIR